MGFLDRLLGRSRRLPGTQNYDSSAAPTTPVAPTTDVGSSGLDQAEPGGGDDTDGGGGE